MKSNNDVKLYNVLFPLWLLILIPSYLWLLLIPLNYLIDTAVCYWSLKNAEDNIGLIRKPFCLRHSWKICIAGFVSDLIGSGILLGITIFLGEFYEESTICNAITGNPFVNIWALLIYVMVIATVGLLIYIIDKKILFKAGLKIEQAIKTAKWLAIITAPYLFLFPTEWLYIQ